MVGIDRSRPLFRALYREPLVHFLAGGALLLAASAWFGRLTTSGGDEHRIHVTATIIRQMREAWASQWGQSPNGEQLQTLIDDYVREEVLVREALASGLDRDDTIIRRHLARKMEFLAQGVAAATEPSEEELSGFFNQRRDHYRVPAKVAFSHVYFSVSTRGSEAVRASASALQRLSHSTNPGLDAHGLGDSFMLQDDYPLQSRDEVRELFGASFADAIFRLPTGAWAGPVTSSYGAHLVYVDRRMEARLPVLDEVRARVVTDLNDQRTRAAVDGYYGSVRKRYRVDIDERAISTP